MLSVLLESSKFQQWPMSRRSLLYIAKNVFIIFIDPVIAAFCSLLMVLLHLSMFNFFKCSGRDFGTTPSVPVITGTIWYEKSGYIWWSSDTRGAYLSTFDVWRLLTLKSSGTDNSTIVHSFLCSSHTTISGRLYFFLFVVCTCWFHQISFVDVLVGIRTKSPRTKSPLGQNPP